MRRTLACFLTTLALTSLLVLSGCAGPGAPSPSEPPTPGIPLVSVGEVERNPEVFRDRLVRMKGHGTIVATFPLCPGYVGLDRRTRFVDAEGNDITAVVRWTPPLDFRMYDAEHLRLFTGYIKIFSGEVGCPGHIQVETFPYFEITGAEEIP